MKLIYATTTAEWAGWEVDACRQGGAKGSTVLSIAGEFRVSPDGQENDQGMVFDDLTAAREWAHHACEDAPVAIGKITLLRSGIAGILRGLAYGTGCGDPVPVEWLEVVS